MEVNITYLTELMKKHNLTQANLAAMMHVDKSTISRILSGNRGPGKEVIAGLLNAFPNEPVEKLFFLERLSSNVDNTGKQKESS